MTDYLVLIAMGYAIGSLPIGLIVGWVLSRADIRRYGSGSTGTTNVLRAVGRPAAVLVLLLDMGKPMIAVVAARALSDTASVEAAAALAVLVGHIWPAFAGFKGGKGAASGWGGLLILAPISGLVAPIVVFPFLLITRYMSLGSLIGATTGAAVLIAISATGHGPMGYIWFGAVGTPLIIARHKDNIKRLLRGEEPKLGQGEGVTGPDYKSGRRKSLRWPRSA